MRPSVVPVCNLLFIFLAVIFLGFASTSSWSQTRFPHDVTLDAKLFEYCAAGECTSWSTFLEANVRVTFCVAATDPTASDLHRRVVAARTLHVVSLIACCLHFLVTSLFVRSCIQRKVFSVITSLLVIVLIMASLVSWKGLTSSCSVSLCDITPVNEATLGQAQCSNAVGMWLEGCSAIIALLSVFPVLTAPTLSRGAPAADDAERQPLVVGRPALDTPVVVATGVVLNATTAVSTDRPPEYYASADRIGYDADAADDTAEPSLYKYT